MKQGRGRPQSEQNADFVHTWDDLAFRLKITRRCLTKWREKFKDEPDFPRPRGDRHDVRAWLKFMADHNLGHEPPEVEGDGEPPKAFWDKQRARIDYERAVYSLELEKQKHLEIDEITAAVGRMLAGFRTALNTMPSSAARWLIGVRDFATIRDKLQEEVDAVLQALGRCDYLETLTAVTADRLFGDKDDAFRSDLIRCVDGVFCELGRLALSDLLQRALAQHDDQTGAISVCELSGSPHPPVSDRKTPEAAVVAEPDKSASPTATAATSKTSRKRRPRK